MPSTIPYRLQVYVPDAIRKGLKDAAYYENMSLQALCETWLTERLKSHPVMGKSSKRPLRKEQTDHG